MVMFNIWDTVKLKEEFFLLDLDHELNNLPLTITGIEWEYLYLDTKILKYWLSWVIYVDSKYIVLLGWNNTFYKSLMHNE